MRRRGAYFFVLDALIGGAIFLLSVVLILGSFLNAPQTKQTYVLAEDLMNLMLSTKVIEFRDPYLQVLSERGFVNNTEQSLFEQIVELHYRGYVNETHNLSESIIDSLLPEQFGASFNIINTTNNNRTILFNRSLNKLNTSSRFLSSKKIAFYSINQTSFFGPDIVEMTIWN